MPDTLTPPRLADAFADRLREALIRHAPHRTNGHAASSAPSAASPDVTNGQCRDDDPLSCGPVGAGEYVVKDSDCLSSIAKETGRLWQTIWNDPANAELRQARKDPNVLLAGDRMTIPPLRQKSEPGKTEMRHRFIRIGQPTVFQLRVAHDNKPLAHRPFTIKYDNDDEFSGTTNSEGFLRCPMPSDARHGHLVLPPGKDQKAQPQREFKLHFGKLQPVESLTGVQQRLRNLGFYGGPNTDTLDEDTRTALKSYQTERGLEPSGNPDAATRGRLKDEHGS